MRRVGHAFEIDRPFAAAVRAPRRFGEARRNTARAVRCPRGAPAWVRSRRPTRSTRSGAPGPRAGRWTRDEQIGSLIRVADSRPDLGFMVRLLALCTLPRTDPGTRTHYVRRNGRLRAIRIAITAACVSVGAFHRGICQLFFWCST